MYLAEIGGTLEVPVAVSAVLVLVVAEVALRFQDVSDTGIEEALQSRLERGMDGLVQVDKRRQAEHLARLTIQGGAGHRERRRECRMPTYHVLVGIILIIELISTGLARIPTCPVGGVVHMLTLSASGAEVSGTGFALPADLGHGGS